MTANIKKHLADRIVAAGSPIQLAVELDKEEGVSYAWQHENRPVTGATGRVHRIDKATAADAGTWTVVIAKDGASTASTATIVVLEPVPAKPPAEAPLVWRKEFAIVAASVLGAVTVLIALPLWWRAWSLQSASNAAGTTDASILAAVIAATGIVLLATAAFMILVELRGRAVKESDTSQPRATVSGDGVAQVVEALGKLRAAQLVAVGGLLALGISGLLGWQIAAPTAEEQIPEPTPTTQATPDSTAPPG